MRKFRIVFSFMCFCLLFYVAGFLLRSENSALSVSFDDLDHKELAGECSQSLVGAGLYALSGLRRVSDRETVSEGRGRYMVQYWLSSAAPAMYPKGWVCIVKYSDRKIIESVDFVYK